MQDFRLLPHSIQGLCSCGVFDGTLWKLITKVSGQPISPILKDQALLILDSVKLSLIAYFTSLIVVDHLLLQIKMTQHKAHRTTNVTAQNQQHPVPLHIYNTTNY
jgi:hypothetical protein